MFKKVWKKNRICLNNTYTNLAEVSKKGLTMANKNVQTSDRLFASLINRWGITPGLTKY
jgi:hypothetical protein